MKSQPLGRIAADRAGIVAEHGLGGDDVDHRIREQVLRLLALQLVGVGDAVTDHDRVARSADRPGPDRFTSPASPVPVTIAISISASSPVGDVLPS